VDPQQASLPADQPAAVDDFGTTVEEQIEGEPLDMRVDRELPENRTMFDEEAVGARIDQVARDEDTFGPSPGSPLSGSPAGGRRPLSPASGSAARWTRPSTA
jgi:hypothetical protein